jgi:acetoin utilization protein AcuB
MEHESRNDGAGAMHPQAYVRDWMSAPVITVREGTSLLGASDLMRHHTIRRLPVIDSRGALCGIVTRSDIDQAAPRDDDRVFALAGRTVEEVMTRGVITVAPDQPVRDAAQMMISRKVSGLPVVADSMLVGIITESDIFRLVVQTWAESPSESPVRR